MATAETDLRVPVELPAGRVEVSATLGRPHDAWALLGIAHGAGAGMRHPFLTGLAHALHDDGIATLRFTFPYLEAGRRMPGPAAHAVATWAGVEAAAAEREPDLPFWASGKSYGGRMASMAAAEGRIAPRGLIYLGYPLHPPGDPAKARTAHLPDVAPPQLFLEGTKDPFIQPIEQLEQAVASCQDAEILWVDGGGHSFEIKGRKRAAEDIGAELAPSVAGWMRRRA
ncbi:alpha/beta hydrolase family protein [Microbacterium flavescens]|uniref:alpha/beta hydrolase family protein n=1 Tax=Microbacterium flavescens TaxID=69366 RepID=UPI001BDE5BC3|nr:alpha/beta family hydrolase [Microbacterium flavescens]